MKGTNRTRVGRWSARGQIYHVVCATKDRHPVFSEFIAARCVVSALARLETVELVRTYAFVVMPDHLHWLFQLAGNADLSTVIGNAKSYSARMVNSHQNMRGAVWQRGFFDQAIRHEENLITLARYIVANPLRAGVVETIGDYPHWDSVWIV